MNTDGDFNDIATNFGKTVFDYFKNEYGIVREDEVNGFKVKYRNHTKNQLKQKIRLKQDTLANCFDLLVPQLSKCLKFEAVWGVLTDQMI